MDRAWRGFWRGRSEGKKDGAGRTFVFEEITHAGSAREDELCDFSNDFRFFFWRKGGEPF